MGAKTGISWTDSSWNPIRGCSMVSDGCRNCYAMMVAARFSGPGQPYEGLAKMTSQGAKWTGKIMVVDHMMEQPIRWNKGRLIFVNSMSDLFHEDLPVDTIRKVFDIMETASHHIFQVLTKRTQRMMEIVSDMELTSGRKLKDAPLPNVWLGTSIENEAAAHRATFLGLTPAAIRFISAEPLIGGIDWKRHLKFGNAKATSADWVIFGGESQTGCRPMDLEWVREGIKTCREMGITPFVKQLGTIWAQTVKAKSRAGEDPDEWPDDLNIREYPIDVPKFLSDNARVEKKSKKKVAIPATDVDFGG